AAQLVSGPAPHAMPGFGLYARLALNGSELWAPALGLSLARAWTDDLAEPGGHADFAIESAELYACPLGVQPRPFSSGACLSSAIGRLSASGSKSYAPQGHSELWASAGGTLLISIALGKMAELQAGFGVVRPFRRYEFAFRPDVFHRVPSLCWQG